LRRNLAGLARPGVKLPSAGRPLSWVAAGRLLRRAGRAVLRAPIAGRADRDVLPGRSGPVAVLVPVRLEHDRLGEGPVGDRAGPA
jgi:hypothetical protein